MAGVQVAQVTNGTVSVGDWVRELPASHFQPCVCCLCRPPGGLRPSWRVRGITMERGRAYLWFGGERAYPADEYERVAAPHGSALEPLPMNGHASVALLLPDSAALSRLTVARGAATD
jgi:hypothetical protein